MAAALLASLSAQPETAEAWRSLFDRHRWFELRDAIAGRPAPPLYRGAIAAAFNRNEAERNLRVAVREATTASAANEAREGLATLYMRLGRSAALATIIDEAVAADSTREDLRAAQRTFAGFRGVPDQRVTRRGSARPFTCRVTANGVRMPARVNGQPVEWLFDTAFSHTSLTESEAHRFTSPRFLGIGEDERRHVRQFGVSDLESRDYRGPNRYRGAGEVFGRAHSTMNGDAEALGEGWLGVGTISALVD